MIFHYPLKNFDGPSMGTVVYALQLWLVMNHASTEMDANSVTTIFKTPKKDCTARPPFILSMYLACQISLFRKIFTLFL